MWLIITDKNSEYLVNSDQVKFIRKGELCHREPTIIMDCSMELGMIFEFHSNEDRDRTYQDIIDRLGITEIVMRLGE